MRLRHWSLEDVLLSGLQVHYDIHRHGSCNDISCRTGCFGRLFFVSHNPLLSLAEAATNVIFVAIKKMSPQIHFCRDKTRISCQQKTSFVTFVATKLCLLRQTRIFFNIYTTTSDFKFWFFLPSIIVNAVLTLMHYKPNCDAVL